MVKLIHAGCFWILVSLLALTGCDELFLDEQQTLDKARDYLSEHNLAAAAIELRNTLKINPDNAEARFLLGSINLDYGDYQTAEKEFVRAEQSGWNPEDTRLGIARGLLGLGRFGDLRRMEVSDQWSVHTRAEMLGLHAVADAGMGNLNDAAELAAKATGLDPEALQALKAGIQLAIIGGQLDQADALAARALQIHADNPELLLLAANIDQKSGRSDEAAATYRRVIDQDPSGFISVYGRNARLQLVQILLAAGDLEQSEENIRPLYRRDPNDPFTNYLGGVLAYQQGRYQVAEERLLKVLKLAPEHNPTRLLYGTVNYAEENYEQAAYFLGKYILAVPDNLVARKLLARSYMLLGQPEDAHAVLKSVVSDDSRDAELLALAGLSEINRGEKVAGIAGLEKALQASPDNITLRRELARAYIEAGDTGLAIDELQSMLAAGGEQTQTETLLVLAHLRAGEFEQAISRVLAMLSQQPDDAVLQTLAGNVFAASGDNSEARKYLNRALQLQPQLPAANLTLAHVEELDGNHALAAGLYQKLVDQGLESALPMLALARVAERQGDREALYKWLERAHEHAPNDIKPSMFLAEYHLRNGEPDKARTLIDEALQIASREPALLSMKARVLMAQKKSRMAIEPLKELLQLDPDSVTGRALLGEVYMQLGELVNARRELTAALDTDYGNAQILALMVRLELASEAPRQALDYASRIRQGYPDLYLGYELAGDVLMAGKDYAAAAEQYDLAWERMNNTELVIKRAENASRSGRPDAAAGYLQGWLDKHPGDVRAMQFLATTWQNMGEVASAIRQYERVLESQPDNQVALNNLAGLYPPSELPRALQLAERAWRAEPDNPGIQDTYGWLLVQAGLMERGMPMLNKAMRALGHIPEVRYHHAVAVIRTGEGERGRQLLEALLAEGEPFNGREDAERLLAGE